MGYLAPGDTMDGLDMAYKEFDDPELLRHLQKVMTRILAEFDRVCTELDLPYVVYGGTAIGAVRHQGFVPWDDDIDICMTRADYERFLIEAPAVLGHEYRLDNTRTNPDFPFMFTKLVLRDTLMVPEFCKKSKYQMPLFLDILPVDNVPDDIKAYRKQARATWFWGRLVYVAGTPQPYLAVDGVARALIHTATTIAYWLLRLTGMTPRRLQRHWERAARRYEHVQTKKMTDFSMRDPENWEVTLDELFPAIEVPFEDITTKIPKEYDTLLRRGYGDYMQLPPVEQRKNHQLYILDMGKYGPEARG